MITQVLSTKISQRSRNPSRNQSLTLSTTATDSPIPQSTLKFTDNDDNCTQTSTENEVINDGSNKVLENSMMI